MLYVIKEINVMLDIPLWKQMYNTEVNFFILATVKPPLI